LATTGRSIALLSAINSSNYILNTSDAISFLLEDTIDLAMTGRSIALLSAINSSNYILNTSNVISTRINNTIIPFTNVITSSGSGTYFCVLWGGENIIFILLKKSRRDFKAVSGVLWKRERSGRRNKSNHASFII